MQPGVKKGIVFPCGRWLARDEDDGQISRDLLPDGGVNVIVLHLNAAEGSVFGSIPYKIHVKTGDRRNAGTDANVYCILFGKKAWVLADYLAD